MSIFHTIPHHHTQLHFFFHFFSFILEAAVFIFSIVLQLSLYHDVLVLSFFI
jgi:hypothetical protein